MEILDRYRTKIVSSLASIVPEAGILRQLIGYPLGAVGADGGPGPGIGGKLLRPSLVLFTCEALGGEVEKALPLAVAIVNRNFSKLSSSLYGK